VQSGAQLLHASAAQTAAWMRPCLGSQPQLLLRESWQLAVAERAIELTVDSTVRELSVSATADSVHGLQVLDPSGSDVSAAGRATAVAGGVLWHLAQPTPGRWPLHLRGAGAFELCALAHSPIRLGRFELLEERGARHEGSLFPIKGPPQPGPAAARAAVYGPARAVRFELPSASGDILHRFSLAEGRAAHSRNRFRGLLQLRAGSVWGYASGIESAGFSFVRVLPRPLDVQVRTPATAARSR
jgi:hypothetical protein